MCSRSALRRPAVARRPARCCRAGRGPACCRAHARSSRTSDPPAPGALADPVGERGDNEQRAAADDERVGRKSPPVGVHGVVVAETAFCALPATAVVGVTRTVGFGNGNVLPATPVHDTEFFVYVQCSPGFA